MAYQDLRDWIEEIDKIGELKRVSGADWNLEAGAISVLTNKAILFDSFPGYPAGYRMIFSMLRSIPRWLAAMNWSTDARDNDLCREFKDRLHNFKPIPPNWIKSGPILENVQEAEDIDVLKFPVPKIHPLDGGRYIGSDCCVIMRDPETDRLNMGIYRIQVHDGKTLGIHASQGKDGHLIMQKYHARGESCPVVILAGMEPVLLFSASVHMTHETQNGEYDFAGWLKGKSIDVIRGEFTHLPIPARAEIAVEGEIPPGVKIVEGPFGEWTGYSEPRKDAVIHIKKVFHRNDPIMTVTSPGEPSRKPEKLRSNPLQAALVWQQMEMAGVREIRGVAFYSRFLLVVSIRNSFGGHAKQAGLVASQCHGGAYLGRYVIVVDEDIDPYKIDEVIWAVIRRTDPQRSLEVIKYCWSSAMDCGLSYEERGGEAGGPIYSSRCIIDACIPLEWGGLKFKPKVEFSAEMKEQMMKKWADVLAD